jgi:hypothetical protein
MECASPYSYVRYIPPKSHSYKKCGTLRKNSCSAKGVC